MASEVIPNWIHDQTAVSTTVQEVADRLHQDMYGPNTHHSGWLSCPCFVNARWFLGVAEKPKLFWPDGKGGNVHERSPDPYIEVLRLRSAVVEAAKAWFHIGASTATDDIKTDARCSLSARVGELEAFEASHAIGQKDGE